MLKERERRGKVRKEKMNMQTTILEIYYTRQHKVAVKMKP